MIQFFLKLIIIYGLCFSCASHQNEHTHYLGIKSYVEKEQYSRASSEILKFESKYPNSEYLCELWNIQIASFERFNRSEKYVKMVKEKREKRCSTLKN